MEKREKIKKEWEIKQTNKKTTQTQHPLKHSTHHLLNFEVQILLKQSMS